MKKVIVTIPEIHLSFYELEVPMDASDEDIYDLALSGQVTKTNFSHVIDDIDEDYGFNIQEIDNNSVDDDHFEFGETAALIESYD